MGGENGDNGRSGDVEATQAYAAMECEPTVAYNLGKGSSARKVSE